MNRSPKRGAEPPRMEPRRAAAALVASLLSQALLSLFLPLSDSPQNAPPPPQFLLLLLLLLDLLNLLSHFQIAATDSLLPPNARKRKRAQQQDPSPLTLPSPAPNPDPFDLSFKVSSSTFEWLSGLLDPLLDCRDPSGPPLLLPGPTRLAIALSRLSSGAPYPDIARRFSVPEPSARFCARRLCRVLCTNFRFWLSFPSPPLPPGCCGAVACPRFDIGGGRTVSAQVVADPSSRILSLVVGFRGEMGDGEVLRRSSLYKDVEGGRLLGGGGGGGRYLVGGGGYPLLPWLMVPFGRAGRGSAEEDFNGAHRLMMGPVERAVCGLREWGVMSRLMEEEDGRMAVACIATCALLHNVLLMRGDVDHSSSPPSNISFGDDDHTAGPPLEVEDCSNADNEAFILRNTLAMKARALRRPTQIS